MARGSLWKNNSLKKFKNWIARGSYGYLKKAEGNKKAGDRFFVLTNVKTGATRVYESHEGAREHGWVLA